MTALFSRSLKAQNSKPKTRAGRGGKTRRVWANPHPARRNSDLCAPFPNSCSYHETDRARIRPPWVRGRRAAAGRPKGAPTARRVVFPVFSKLKTKYSKHNAQRTKLKAQSSKLKAQNSKLKTQSSKLKAQNSKLKAQNSILKAQSSKLKTQNYKLQATS